jgi:hypothetical protein
MGLSFKVRQTDRTLLIPANLQVKYLVSYEVTTHTCITWNTKKGMDTLRSSQYSNHLFVKTAYNMNDTDSKRYYVHCQTETHTRHQETGKQATQVALQKSHLSFLPNAMGEWLTLLLHIQKVPGSYLSPSNQLF